MTGQPSDGDESLTAQVEELAAHVGEALRRAKDDQDATAFEEVAEVILDLLESNAPSLAGTVLHYLLLVMAERKADGEPSHGDPVELLQQDLNHAVSPAWEGPIMGRVSYLAGRISVAFSNWTAAREFFSESLQLLDGSDLCLDIALAHQALAGAYSMQGERELAVASSTQALELYQGMGDTRRTAEVLLNLAQDNLPESTQAAVEYLDRAEYEIARLNDGHLNAAVIALRAMVHVELADYAAAEPLLRKAVASATRRGDALQEQQNAQNLANVIDETKGPRRALPWRVKALRIAQERHDMPAEAALSRAVALTLARLQDLEGAIEHLKACVELNTELGDKRRIAEAEADLGAMILSHETGVLLTFADEDPHTPEGRIPKLDSGTSPREPHPDSLDHALGYLGSALETFLEITDSEWISRVATNRRNLLQLRGSSEAVQDLLNISDQVRHFDPKLAADLIREAARTECAAGVDPAYSLELYVKFVEAQGAESDTNRAWALVESAAELAQLGTFYDQAVELLDRAVLLYLELNDVVNASTALNDYGVAVHQSGDNAKATSAFRRVVQMAEDQNNRVLKEMGLNNLAQMLAEAGQVEEAVECYEEAAAAAAAIGDHQSSADHWCQVSGLWLNNRDLNRAKAAIPRARQQALLDGGAQAAASVQSAEGALAFAEGEYRQAFLLWQEAAEGSQAPKLLERLSFALEAQARAGDSAAFRRSLRNFSARAQSDNAQQAASELLWRPALSSLRAGKAKDAALALATAALLSTVEALGARRSIEFSRLTKTSSLPQPLKSFLVTFAQIATVLTHEEVSPSLRTKCRELISREWRRHGDDVAEFLNQRLQEAEGFLSEDD